MAKVLLRIGRIVLTVLLALVGFVIGLVVLVFVALAIPPVRAFAVQKGVSIANDNLGGMTVQVKSVDRIDPWGINIRGVSLADEQKRELVHVPWLMVRLNPFALVKNTLAITRVNIDGVRGRLYPPEAGPPEPEEVEPASEPSQFTIRVDELRIRDAELLTEFDNRMLRARIGSLVAGGKWGPTPALAIKEAHIRATANDELLLRLRTTEGAWTADRGGRIGIEARLAGAPLVLQADIPALDEVEPWPIRSASLKLSGVNRKTLTMLGVPDGAELHVPVALDVEARSQGARIEATAKLRAGQGALELVASADDKAYELDLDVAPTHLAAIAGILPALTVRGKVHVLAWPSKNESGVPEKVQLSWRNVALDGASVPGGKLRAELPLPIVRLESLTLTGMEQALKLSGEYDLDRSRGRGEIAFDDFRLHAIEFLEKQGIAGTLDGGLGAKLGAGAIEGGGKLEIDGFSHPSARFSQLDLSLALKGTLLAPQGQFNLRINELVAGNVKIDRITSEALATPNKVTGRMQLRGPDTLMNAELGGQRRDNGDLRLQAIGRGQVAKRRFDFDLRELLYGPHGLTVQELGLFSGEQGVRLSGSLDEHDNVHAEIKLANIDLEEWAELAGVEKVKGRLGAAMKIGGTTAEPNVDGTIELVEGQYMSKLPVNATLALKGDLRTRKAEANLTMYSDEELGARLSIAVAVPKRPADLAKALKAAHLKADLKAWLPMDQISAMGGDQLAGLGGHLDAVVKAEGTLDAPKLEADVRASLKLPEQQGEPVEGVRLLANIDKQQAKLDVWAKDELGELLTLNGFVEWPQGSPRAALENPNAWRNARFQTRAELQPRRLDTMQGVFAYFSKIYALSLPLRTAAKVSFEGNRGTLEGAAAMQLVIYGDKLDGRCKLGAQSSAEIEAKLKQDRLELALSALTDGGGKLTANLSSALELNALTGEEPVIGPAKLTLAGRQIAIHKLPGLCNLAGGSASFDMVAEGLGKRRPSVELTTTIRDLHAQGQAAMRVDAKATAGGKEARLSAQIKSKDSELATIEGSVPLAYPDGTTPTVLPNAPVDARIRFDKLPLANVLAFTEALGRVGGFANADLKVTGPLNDPYPAGHLELVDVNVSVASIAQPFRNIDGRFEIKGRSLKIDKLTAHDRDGKLSLQGFANLNRDLTGTGGLYLEADKFPLRQQGTVIGELTTRARMDVKIPTDLKAQAELKILDGRIWLTGERGKKVQSLDPHPDIRFSDEKIEYESTTAEEKAEGGGIALGSFRMRTERELWLMHKDFGLQVGVDLRIIDDPEVGIKIEGEATLVRGELQLLGKPFKLDKGSIRFGGDMPPDPELDIKAIFSPPRGDDLVVQVSGRGSAPVLEFSGAATTAGEAVAVLTGGVGGASGNQSKSGAESDATSQMAGIAADMTAGLLVMTARREFGDWVPMISIETGQSGEPTSARAGFDASKLIPPWLEGFAKGAYVEGIVGQNANTGGKAGVGVKLEVALPRDFITSLEYGPGPGWATDVAWSP